MKEIMVEVLTMADELGNLKQELLMQDMRGFMDMMMKCNTTEIILDFLMQVQKNRAGCQKRNIERNKQRMMHTFIEGIAVIDIRSMKLMIF
ncbi:hypothetical protein QEZ44_12670 [Bacillus cereus]|nr:hypothetical protein [Bacillus cereus]